MENVLLCHPRDNNWDDQILTQTLQSDMDKIGVWIEIEDGKE